MFTSSRKFARLTAGAVVLTSAGLALAGPVVLSSGSAASGPTLGGETGSSGYNALGAALDGLRAQLDPSGGMGGMTDDPTFPAARQTSLQSLSLRMLGFNGATGFANSFGEVVVQLNTGYQSLGVNPAGRAVQGQVRQYFTPDERNFIEATIRTVDQSPLVPVGTTVSGQTVVAFGWEVGRTDPIDWLSLWTHVDVPANGAIATFSGPGGQVSINHTPELVGAGGGAWNGSDPDNLLISLGDLFHTVRIVYEVQPVPAPAGLALLGVAAGLGARRRR